MVPIVPPFAQIKMGKKISLRSCLSPLIFPTDLYCAPPKLFRRLMSTMNEKAFIKDYADLADADRFLTFPLCISALNYFQRSCE